MQKKNRRIQAFYIKYAAVKRSCRYQSPREYTENILKNQDGCQKKPYAAPRKGRELREFVSSWVTWVRELHRLRLPINVNKCQKWYWQPVAYGLLWMYKIHFYVKLISFTVYYIDGIFYEQFALYTNYPRNGQKI